ncbi:hypothetical protein D3C71_1804900 [compost metagenome]
MMPFLGDDFRQNVELPKYPDGQYRDHHQHNPDEHIGDGVLQVSGYGVRRNGQERGRDGYGYDES